MKGIKNLYTILTNCETKLPDESVDIILLFYILHDFKDPNPIIMELDRTLKPSSILTVIDHKFDKDRVVSVISHAASLLKLRDTRIKNGNRVLLIFSKQESP